MSDISTVMIEGVALQPLVTHTDERGFLTEIWRASGPGTVVPRQWNVVKSESGVLRGVHLHERHGDHLVLAKGRAVVGLHDLRRESPTYRQSEMVELRAGSHALEIPPGVAHGFCFPEPSVHVYGVSHYFDPEDELGCRYDDPELGLDWPITPTLVSERDLLLPPLADLIATGDERGREVPSRA